MAEGPLPQIAFAHNRRTRNVRMCILALALLLNFLLPLVGRWTTSFVPLYCIPLPYLVVLAYDVRNYLWKRRLRRRVFDQDRLKGLPCEHCLYDCTGNVSGQCPECAWVIVPDLAQRWENWRRTFWLVRLREYFGGHQG